MSQAESNTDFTTFISDEYLKASVSIVRLDNLSTLLSNSRHKIAEVLGDYRNNPDKELLDELVQEEKDVLEDFNEVLKIALFSCYNLMLSATQMHSAYSIMSNAINDLTKEKK